MILKEKYIERDVKHFIKEKHPKLHCLAIIVRKFDDVIIDWDWISEKR